MRTKTLYKSLVFMASLTLLGCGQKTQIHTVDALVEDEELRSQILEDCKNDKQTTENCENANTALSKVQFEEYRKKAFS